MKDKKQLNWIVGIIIITIILCGTIIWINHNSWTLRFEMDENTKEAIKSIEWNEINEKEEGLFYDDLYDGCVEVPCECLKWGCALYCMECEDLDTNNEESK